VEALACASARAPRRRGFAGRALGTPRDEPAARWGDSPGTRGTVIAGIQSHHRSQDVAKIARESAAGAVDASRARPSGGGDAPAVRAHG